MIPFLRRLLLPAMLGLAVFPLQGCSPVSLLNTLSGQDAAGGAVATGIPYGPNARHRLDVYSPRTSAANLPVVVFLYGGSWDSGNRQDYAFVGSALAAKGFMTIIADYRLVPEIRFPGFLEDGALAVRWAQDNAQAYGGDPRRIALAGHSAGAYNAVMLALDKSYLRAAGVDTGRIKAVAALSGPYDFYPFDVSASIAAFGQEPQPQRTQPINFARPGSPAAFLATGTADTTVLPRNTNALAARLRASGSSVTVRTYQGIDHAGTLVALSQLGRNRAPVLDDMAGFLQQKLGQAAR